MGKKRAGLQKDLTAIFDRAHLPDEVLARQRTSATLEQPGSPSSRIAEPPARVQPAPDPQEILMPPSSGTYTYLTGAPQTSGMARAILWMLRPLAMLRLPWSKREQPTDD